MILFIMTIDEKNDTKHGQGVGQLFSFHLFPFIGYCCHYYYNSESNYYKSSHPENDSK